MSAKKGKPNLHKKASGNKDIELLGTSLVFLALGFAGIGELVLKVGAALEKSKKPKPVGEPEKDAKPSVQSEWDAFVAKCNGKKTP